MSNVVTSIAEILKFGKSHIILEAGLKPINFLKVPANFASMTELLINTACYYQVASLAANQIGVDQRMFAVLN